MKNEAQYWFDLSDYDFATAHALYESERYRYVVFMCHQAIEKAIKAYQTEIKERKPLKIHSLWKLMYQTGLYRKFSKRQIEFIGFLEPLNVESRYPSGVMEPVLFIPDRNNCRKLVSDTAEVLRRIREEAESGPANKPFFAVRISFSGKLELSPPSVPGKEYMEYFKTDQHTVQYAYGRRYRAIF